MKRMLTFLAAVLVTGASFAGNPYKMDDQQLDNMFNQATEVAFNVEALDAMNVTSDQLQMLEGEQTVLGYLLRAYFCGFVALHRSYMGTGGETLWWKYMCIPVVGGVVGCVDFWWVVFKGEEAMEKYRDNGAYMVWNEK